MEQLTGPGPNDTWTLDLNVIIADLEAALRLPSANHHPDEGRSPPRP
jgi:hypothetical protein